MRNFQINVSYAQISVFGSHLATPFNDWSEEHVKQGFAWRPGSVSFATFEDGGVVRVHILSTPLDPPSSSASRIIQVPFEVAADSLIDVASIGQAVTIELSPGKYSLVFEHGVDGEGMWVNFHFTRSDDVKPEIIRKDSQLEPPSVLVMTASPA